MGGRKLNFYWIPDENYVFSKAEVVDLTLQEKEIIKIAPLLRIETLTSESHSNLIYLRDKNGEVLAWPHSRILQFDKSHDCASPDLALTSTLNDAALLNILRLRFVQKKIYTAASPMIISINPYENIPDLYDLCKYRQLTEHEKKAHLFAVADKAIENIQYKSQSITVSGESGAGKTESCKKILAYLIRNSKSDLENLSNLESQILACNPILERHFSFIIF